MIIALLLLIADPISNTTHLQRLEYYTVTECEQRATELRRHQQNVRWAVCVPVHR